MYFLQHNKTLFGTRPSTVFGFKNMKSALLVKQHVQFLPSMEKVEEMPGSSGRFLIKTHYNTDNNITPTPKKIEIISRTFYEASLVCGVNNISLGVVNHVYERDDGDIELLCAKPVKAERTATTQLRRYNLELIFRNNKL